MIKQDNALLLIIDIQDKLVKMLGETNLPHKAKILSKSAQILDIPTMISEQYPKGLGATIEGLTYPNTLIFEKTSFNALDETSLLNAIYNTQKNQILLCGIETHICVYQTALALKQKGFDVYLIQDACSSRDCFNHQVALDDMRQRGIRIISLEMALFEILASSQHKKFKEIQSFIK